MKLTRPRWSAADRGYFADKIDIDIYFSAVKGWGQRDDTIEVMGLYAAPTLALTPP